jgi:dihydropyrimidinase
MTTTIRNGAIVTADLTNTADVQIENGTIIAIGSGLRGGTELDATGTYVMPGGIDPHRHPATP